MASLHLLGSPMIRGASSAPGLDPLQSWQFKENGLSFSASIFLEVSSLLKSESFELESNPQILIFSFALGLLALEIFASGMSRSIIQFLPRS